MKRLAILGSTGSIGTSTLDVIASHASRFRVAALAAGSNLDLLEQQIDRCRPELVAVRTPEAAAELRRRRGGVTRIVHGPGGLVEVATCDGVDLVVSALVGAVGLEPTYAAVDRGVDVALANKEALVVAGEHMTRRARETGAQILPIDSEHNALHQCLRGEAVEEVRRLWLTASGGPFRGYSKEQLAEVGPEEALRHPNWTMGRKITVDSATLMNKGLEVIEAHWLFGIEGPRIGVVVHPQSIIHSMIEFVDGSFKAQLGITDMRHPIQYALTWPSRVESPLEAFSPVKAGTLEFEEPDRERFPCLDLAYRALEMGGAAPVALNAANEVSVEAFLDNRVRFTDIPRAIRATIERHARDSVDGFAEVVAIDAQARRTATEILARGVYS